MFPRPGGIVIRRIACVLALCVSSLPADEALQPSLTIYNQNFAVVRQELPLNMMSSRLGVSSAGFLRRDMVTSSAFGWRSACSAAVTAPKRPALAAGVPQGLKPSSFQYLSQRCERCATQSLHPGRLTLLLHLVSSLCRFPLCRSL